MKPAQQNYVMFLLQLTFQLQLNSVLNRQDIRHIFNDGKIPPADIHQVNPCYSFADFVVPVCFCVGLRLTTGPTSFFIFRHNTHTARPTKLTKLSAVWDPKREDCFVVSSSRPRSVQVFHQSGQLQRHFVDGENFNTVLSVAAFHPSRNAFVGGNGSGRLQVFSD